jgi:hypothetical protein
MAILAGAVQVPVALMPISEGGEPRAGIVLGYPFLTKTVYFLLFCGIDPEARPAVRAESDEV